MTEHKTRVREMTKTRKRQDWTCESTETRKRENVQNRKAAFCRKQKKETIKDARRWKKDENTKKRKRPIVNCQITSLDANEKRRPGSFAQAHLRHVILLFWRLITQFYLHSTSARHVMQAMVETEHARSAMVEKM